MQPRRDLLFWLGVLTAFAALADIIANLGIGVSCCGFVLLCRLWRPGRLSAGRHTG